MVKHLVKAWKAVLPENGPCGEDVSFSPEFEALRNEVEKSTSLHATEGPDWDAVRNMATEILSTRSKDLWAMAYASTPPANWTVWPTAPKPWPVSMNFLENTGTTSTPQPSACSAA